MIATSSITNPIGTNKMPNPGSPLFPPNAPSKKPPGKAINAHVKLADASCGRAAVM